MTCLEASIEAVRAVQPLRVTGRVAGVRGLTVLVDDLPLPVGSLVEIGDGGRGPEPAGAGPGGGGREVLGEVVGFTREHAVVMPLGETAGIRVGDRVVGRTAGRTVGVGASLLGRVVDGLGRPIDGKGPLRDTIVRPVSPPPLPAMGRRRISRALYTGVRSLDLFVTLGRGQRIGIFSGPGVGKSTLLGAIARRTEADVSVIALVGERGREVMLMMDSVTRFAHAQRQIGLSAGEPPATKGYTPSVFSALSLLLERAGAVEGTAGAGGGSITGLYTILVEGDDLSEPVSDAARGILDGHVILSRRLAQRAHYPAVDILDSVSRVAEDVCDAAHRAARQQLLRLMAVYREVEDLVQIGAYARGSNPEADAAIDFHPRIDELLRQGRDETQDFVAARDHMIRLALEVGDQLHRRRRERTPAQRPGAA